MNKTGWRVAATFAGAWIVLGLVLGGCSDTSSSQADDWRSGSPSVGSCFGALTETGKEPVVVADNRACTEPHMGEVLDVSRLPHTLASGKTPPSEDATQLDDQWDRCRDTLSKQTPSLVAPPHGQDAENLTAVTAWLQLPDKSAWESGARWVACAAQLTPGKGLALSTPLSAVLSTSHIDPSIDMCLTPATPPDYTVVACSEPHTVQLLGRFDLADAEEAPFPGVDLLDAQATAACKALVQQVAGPIPVTDQNVFWRHPNESGWKKGQREVVCGTFIDGAKPA